MKKNKNVEENRPFYGLPMAEKIKVEEFCRDHKVEFLWKFDELWGELVLRTKKDDIQWNYQVPWNQQITAQDILIPLIQIYGF